MTDHLALRPGATAVITGAADGIGLAVAGRLAARGMNVVMADLEGARLDQAAALVGGEATQGAVAVACATDVSDAAAVTRLKDFAYDRFGSVAFLMNNAGVAGGAQAHEHPDRWAKVLAVNLGGVINGVQAFAAAMIAQGGPAVIVNTGSKQGITMPPGDTAYNVSKAAIKALTEGLQHTLRETPGCAVSAHLLIPGFTFTGLTRARLSIQPPGAWSAEHVADFMLERLAAGDFYILCPDNDTPRALDEARMLWTAGDIVANRPPLSRWHKDYKDDFAAFVKCAGRRVTVDVVTFGCRLNACESESLRARAAADGVMDAVVFNTCAVTGEAVRQARQAIRKARRERPGARVIVTGCAAQIDPAGFAAMPEVDLVLGNAEKREFGAMLEAGARVGDIMATRAIAPSSGAHGERARAYVEIQNGCDHRCTFCVIPFGRGNSRSSPAADVVARVRELSGAGYAEVVLTGVDLTSWGEDLPGSPPLGVLVRRILRELPGLPRLRLSSIDAAEIDTELMACLAEEARLAPHLHLSLQSGDDLILKRMKRRHSRADALALIAAVRRVRPEAAFGADLIAGFPTESDAAFENTLRLVEEAGLSYLHVFPYSPRPGTPAARMPPVPGAVIKARAARLRAAGDAALVRHLDRQVGREVTALVERDGRARAEDFTEVVFEGDAPAGSVIVGVIVGHDGKRARVEAWTTAGVRSPPRAPSVTARERAPRHLPREEARVRNSEQRSPISNPPPPPCGGGGAAPSCAVTEGAQGRVAMPA